MSLIWLKEKKIQIKRLTDLYVTLGAVHFPYQFSIRVLIFDPNVYIAHWFTLSYGNWYMWGFLSALILVTCSIFTFVFMSSLRWSSAWRSLVPCWISNIVFIPCKAMSLHWNWFLETSPVTFHTVAPEILIREVIFFSHWWSC